ncbi:P-loop containing nucleoside triphosphate hydrolase protein [Zopfia rhizophila CBS 207.26]|uniref:P-loop containing nucleoside triphosphate hydrolase protein n=1 Tax=Zopfia rhizophila CBS 207.26 TaxID=1314779 RepID=A0A6A6F0T0_9PEZI|nr:P-loop containing nucleoside triphosphate hydrolase protein [Zopfia rhizophila CBS 207.26]
MASSSNSPSLFPETYKKSSSAKHAKKRRLDNSNAEEQATIKWARKNALPATRIQFDDAQKSESSESSDSTTPSQLARIKYQVVHQVICSRHPGHGRALYRRPPRLYAGDGKLSVLRRRKQIREDILSEAFAEENPDVGFIVVKNYDCGKYHDELTARDAFKSLPGPIAKALGKTRGQVLYLNEDGPEADVEIENIHFVAHHLKSAMRDIRALYPQYFGATGSADTLEAPYLGFYHLRSILAEHLFALPHGTKRDNIACLVRYIQTARAQEYKEADDLFAEGKVTRRHFAKLFGPGDIVIRRTDDGPIGYMIAGFPTSSEQTVDLDCWNWDFDGAFAKKRSRCRVTWPSSADIVTIKSLALYPLKYDVCGMRQRLHDRGHQFWLCRKQRLVECDFLAASFDFRATSDRYMIDLKTYKNLHPPPDQEQRAERQLTTSLQLECAEHPPDDDFLLLLPATIRGYGFNDKEWRMLPVEQIRDIRWSSDTFDSRLVLDYKKKELIKALVTVHSSSSTKQQKSDIIEGKGKGLILLLHGGPGTGKTLTAESIAEYAQRPLYRVTCGDIGTNPESVEKYLDSVLYIGTIWRCVVLLDEADVFLEERTPTDLKRNALVSVFLRTLEYYEGILVLTSNRVCTFDEAFKSRVQLAMRYPPLDFEDRLEVWHMFFRDMLEGDERVKRDELNGRVDMLARHDLNGRQIRNVINTARQLARYKKEILAYTHIDQALQVAKEFEEYVSRTKGHSDEEFAKAEGLR